MNNGLTLHTNDVNFSRHYGWKDGWTVWGDSSRLRLWSIPACKGSFPAASLRLMLTVGASACRSAAGGCRNQDVTLHAIMVLPHF